MENCDTRTKKEKLKIERRNVLVRMFLLAVSLIIVVTATIAWLASNNEVQVNGMQVTADVPANMVIAKSLSDIRSMKLDNNSFSVTFDAETKALMPARHHALDEDYPVGLEYNSNPSAVSASTGLASDPAAEALAFEPVKKPEKGMDKFYYYDYEVYLAANPKELQNQKLYAEINAAPSSDPEEVFKACTIDFYVSTINTSLVYMGSATLNGGSSPALFEGNIPLNTDISQSPIKILMRCYFDGGLMAPDNSHTYVNSDDIDELLSKRLGVCVSFHAVGEETAEE